VEASEYPNVTKAGGYAVGHLDDLGEGPGFRKVRRYVGRDGIAQGSQRVGGPPGAGGASAAGP
jgi:hypothetical protein